MVLTILCGCAEPGLGDELVTMSGSTMGTTYHVTLAGLPPGFDVPQLQAAIDACLEGVEDRMSTYRPESELSRFNAHAGRDWFGVSPETALVVAEARRISELSGGAFDVTVGPLVTLWNFGPESHERRLPSNTEIKKAKELVGYDRIDVRDSPPALRKLDARVYVDLSAIAKGFAVDQVARMLDERGVAGYLVEVGGEVHTKGAKPDGRAWTIGVETPTPHQRGIQKRVPLRGRAMATSGDYRNFIEIDGERYSHTIDPRTGRPVQHRLASVTVVDDSCMRADALATALMVLGPKDGHELAVKEKLAVLLILRADDGFVEKATPAFETLLAEQSRSLGFSKSQGSAEEQGGSPATVFLAALIVFGLAVVAMAVGVIFRFRCLLGTCGGLANLQDDQDRPLCDACAAERAQRSENDQAAGPSPGEVVGRSPHKVVGRSPDRTTSTDRRSPADDQAPLPVQLGDLRSKPVAGSGDPSTAESTDDADVDR